MLKFVGKYAEAKVFIDTVEDNVSDQIKGILDCPAFEGQQIRIMSDVHFGKGSVIGFTSTLHPEMVSSNVIGVDIGCGVSSYELAGYDPDYQIPDFPALDKFIRENVPNGFSVHEESLGFTLEEEELVVQRMVDIANRIGKEDAIDRYKKSIGSLGGGNHFIEVNQGVTGDYWLTLHSGSRKFGLDIATFFWKLAKEQGNYTKGAKDLAWLEGKDYTAYLECMKVAQQYAKLNRKCMAELILTKLGYDEAEVRKVESVHNYIDFSGETPMIRKGAISAKKGEEVIIPWNMAEGCIIGVGKGNEDYNLSAPHGAGRTMGRKVAKETLNMDDYKKAMIGVWSSCIGEETLDEAPDAYKDSSVILSRLEDTVEVKDTLKSVYNFKAGVRL